MKEYALTFTLFLMTFSCTISMGQNKTPLPNDSINDKAHEAATSYGPNTITRTLEQDRNGNIWLATFQGVFQYDGRSFINIISEVSSARFFSVLEDRRGNMWFGSIGSGVYCFDGKSFQNFTTNDGLPNNEILSIYEDRSGGIWLGVNGGASHYDGESFRNFILSRDSIFEDRSGKTIPDFTRPPNEVNAIIEDKTGRFWFATRSYSFRYDGKAFVTLTYNGKPFTNVRSIIEDQKGNIWLGGNDGLWCYDGNSFTNITEDFVGYIYEDKNGNIWTSSQTANGRWVLSRYDERSLSGNKPTAIEINAEHDNMIFGILEADDGSIWYGALDGVYRYDGKTITDFKQ